MTRKEFEELQLEHASSGLSLMSFLKKPGVAYTTFHIHILAGKVSAPRENQLAGVY